MSMSLIIMNAVILIASYLAVNYAYATYDRAFYRCSLPTHAFGMLFPLAAIAYINMLHLARAVTITLSSATGALSLVVLGLSYSMLLFHLFYHFDREEPAQAKQGAVS